MRQSNPFGRPAVISNIQTPRSYFFGVLRDSFTVLGQQLFVIRGDDNPLDALLSYVSVPFPTLSIDI